MRSHSWTKPYPEWRFHVTTIIKKKNSTDWITLDPIMGRHLSVKDWVAAVRRGWDTWQTPPKKIHQARLFLVPPTAVMPDIRKSFVPENGTVIIDVQVGEKDKAFDPEAHNILKSPGWVSTFQLENDTIYEVKPEETHKYFITTNNPQAEKGFDFIGIKIEVFDGIDTVENPEPSLLDIPYNLVPSEEDQKVDRYFVDLQLALKKQIDDSFYSLSPANEYGRILSSAPTYDTQVDTKVVEPAFVGGFNLRDLGVKK